MQVKALGRVGFTGVGVPTFDPTVVAGSFQSGDWSGVITDTGVGDVTPIMLADRGVELANSLELACPSGLVLAGSDLVSVGVLPAAGDINKQVTIVQEQAGGAATIRADVAFDLAIIDLTLEKWDGGWDVIAAGRLLPNTGAGTVAFDWQCGAAASIVYNAAGDYTINLQPNRGIAQTDCIMLASVNALLPLSGMVGFSCIHTSATAKRIMTVQEQAAGAASLLVDPVDAAAANAPIAYAILAPADRMGKRMHPCMARGARIVAGCVVNGAVGTTFAAQSSRILSVVRTPAVPAGSWDVTMRPDAIAAPARCAMLMTGRRNMALQRATNFSAGNFAGGVKRVQCLQETGAGGGAASALTDSDFSLLIIEAVN